MNPATLEVDEDAGLRSRASRLLARPCRCTPAPDHAGARGRRGPIWVSGSNGSPTRTFENVETTASSSRWRWCRTTIRVSGSGRRLAREEALGRGDGPGRPSRYRCHPGSPPAGLSAQLERAARDPLTADRGDPATSRRRAREDVDLVHVRIAHQQLGDLAVGGRDVRRAGAAGRPPPRSRPGRSLPAGAWGDDFRTSVQPASNARGHLFLEIRPIGAFHGMIAPTRRYRLAHRPSRTGRRWLARASSSNGNVSASGVVLEPFGPHPRPRAWRSRAARRIPEARCRRPRHRASAARPR